MSPIMLSLLFLSILIQNIEANVYTHAEAVRHLNSAGIGIFLPSQCNNRQNEDCTFLDGIQSDAIDGLIKLKNDARCRGMTVIGETEFGHQSDPNFSANTRDNKRKLNIFKEGESCPTEYIKREFREIAENMWWDRDGTIYLDRRNHWEIEYANRQEDEDGNRKPEDQLFGNGNENENEQPENHLFGNGQENGNVNKKPENPLLNNGNVNKKPKDSLLDQCIKCLCKVESNCLPAECNFDSDSPTCGYFHISKDYYMDCGMPDMRPEESVIKAWQRCAVDFECGSQCVKNYLQRYSHNCPGKNQCENIARLHKGGPNGCMNPSTLKHWQKVEICFESGV